MKRFIDQYEDIVKKYPGREAFVDRRERVDYQEFDTRASKIYAYLKRRGIAKEDIVMLLMPRGIDAYAAQIGVMKCGAAFLTLEDTYPVNRVSYIKEDVSPKLVLDEETVKEVYREEAPLPGHEETDVHDALLAVYTSGSTGNPKGILHEYGLADELMAPGYYQEKEIGGITSPLYFIANYIFFISFLAKAITIHIIDEGMVRDFDRLKAYIYDEKLNLIYLPPAYIRIYTEPSPYLRMITTGSEPANGLFYKDSKPAIFNVYSMSEAGFYVLQTVIDKKYDVAPVGQPSLKELRYVIVDEDGKVIEGEGHGELCLENPFSRGYIHLPEKTKEVFVDGLYHTRDVVRRDRDGMYYVIGRIDDMIKIAGNRIEPAEIEARVQDITGLKKVVAKGFDTGERAFICVYYLRGEASRLGILEGDTLAFDHERLKTLLPEYMIPSYYIPIDEFPLTDSKKIAKKLLKMPQVSDYLADYEPPADDREQYLCELFAKVLQLPRVGRNDDFFLLGGDSMKAIQCVSQSVRYAFTANELRENSTAAKLGKICRERGRKDPGENRMVKGSRQENISGAPFTGLFRANVTISGNYTLKHEIDRQLLQQAWDRVLLRYPFFRQALTLDQEKLYYEWKDADTRVSAIGEKTGIIDRPMVSAGGNQILVRIPHAYTDGFGAMVFEQTLLEEYLALRAGNAEPVGDAGYIEEQYYEMLSEDYSEYGKTIPDLYRGPWEIFRFHPEHTESDRHFFYDYEISLFRLEQAISGLFPEYEGIDKDALSQIGGALSVGIAGIVARAVNRVHPDNRLPVVCRFPVNMRTVLGHEGSLKNMSLCQAAIRLSDAGTGRNFIRLMADAREAAGTDILKWQLSVIQDLLRRGESGPGNEETLMKLFNPTFLLSSLVSRSKDTPPDEIADTRRENSTDTPLAVYISNFGETIRIRFIQQFEDDRYFSQFCRLCGS